jgi:hypothetical protein
MIWGRRKLEDAKGDEVHRCQAPPIRLGEGLLGESVR